MMVIAQTIPHRGDQRGGGKKRKELTHPAGTAPLEPKSISQDCQKIQGKSKSIRRISTVGEEMLPCCE
jgi:hypothetical protein